MKMLSKRNNWQRHVLPIIALLVFSPMLFAQENMLKVSGKVVDENNEPLTGVSIYSVNASTLHGTASDINGNYEIEVPAGCQITYSFIGYVDQTFDAVEGVINVSLAPDTSTLDESVVVGYGTQKRSSLTGAIASVNSEDLENRTTTTLQASLQGKTAGVQIIQTSGSPGSAPTVRIRGYSSNAGSDPLYVVDGVRISDISGIDPNDIESMEILKDAASAAIYGSEAGNGVVLITTKRGKKGEGRITYDYQITSQSISRVPKMMNAEEYINYMVEGGLATREEMLANWDGVTDTNWADVTFENSLMQKHNLSVSNANDKASYYVSLSYLTNNGIIRGDSDTHKRLTGVINAEWRIKDWLTVGTTNQLEKYTTKGVAENYEYASVLFGTLNMDPLTKPTYKADELTQVMINALNNGYTLDQDKNGDYYGISSYLTSGPYNPLIRRDSYTAESTGFNINGSAYLNFNPFKFLTFTSRFGYRLEGYGYSETDLPFYANGSYSSLYVSGQSNTSSTDIYYQWENFLNYNQTFGKHTIGAMIGMSFQKETYNYVTGSLSQNGEDVVEKNDPLFYYLNYASSSAVKGVAGETTYTAKLSYFGRINYEYAGRYMVQASLRADAADLSMLPKSGRWGYFPAVSAGWVISEERFFSKAKEKVNQLKLRASWGQNGSLAALGNYAYSSDMQTSTVYPMVSGNTYVTSVYPISMGNPNLTWETSEQLDVGIDSRFFNDRFSFSVDWYTKSTKNLLVTGTVPSLDIGGTTSPMNAGNVNNRGFEFDLGWKDTKGDFFYSIRANVSTLRNRVTYLDPSLTRIAGTSFASVGCTYFEQGYPIYYFRGYKFDKVDPATGDPTFVDIDGDGVINENDLTYIGDGIPRVTYGITFNFAWKGIDLVIFGSGADGNKIWNRFLRNDFPFGNKIESIFYNDRWTETNTSGSVPRANSNNVDKYLHSSAMVFNGSYFKIKQIQLGYSFPKAWMQKIRVNNLRVYVSLDDFFTICTYPGFDPEASSEGSISGMGIDNGVIPNSKKVVFGVNLEF